jgi:hypothetical protein
MSNPLSKDSIAYTPDDYESDEKMLREMPPEMRYEAFFIEYVERIGEKYAIFNQDCRTCLMTFADNGVPVLFYRSSAGAS